MIKVYFHRFRYNWDIWMNNTICSYTSEYDIVFSYLDILNKFIAFSKYAEIGLRCLKIHSLEICKKEIAFHSFLINSIYWDFKNMKLFLTENYFDINAYKMVCGFILSNFIPFLYDQSIFPYDKSVYPVNPFNHLSI